MGKSAGRPELRGELLGLGEFSAVANRGSALRICSKLLPAGLFAQACQRAQYEQTNNFGSKFVRQHGKKKRNYQFIR